MIVFCSWCMSGDRMVLNQTRKSSLFPLGPGEFKPIFCLGFGAARVGAQNVDFVRPCNSQQIFSLFS